MKRILILLSLLPTMAFANCDYKFKTLNLCGEITWKSKPVSGKATDFDLKFFKSDDKKKVAIDPGKSLNIFSWMKMSNGHDHGGPGLVVKREGNIWNVSKARFFGGMSGTWWIRVEVKDTEKTIETVEFPVNL